MESGFLLFRIFHPCMDHMSSLTSCSRWYYLDNIQKDQMKHFYCPYTLALSTVPLQARLQQPDMAGLCCPLGASGFEAFIDRYVLGVQLPFFSSEKHWRCSGVEIDWSRLDWKCAPSDLIIVVGSWGRIAWLCVDVCLRAIKKQNLRIVNRNRCFWHENSAECIKAAVFDQETFKWW